MTFKVDFLGERTLIWSKERGEVKYRTENYIPSFYISSERKNLPLRELRNKALETDHVLRAKTEKWKTSLGQKNPEDVLRADVNSLQQLKPVVYDLRRKLPLDQVRFYNVDIARQFRYCLDNREKPLPDEELGVLELEIPKNKIAEKDLASLKINGEIHRTERRVLHKLKKCLKTEDPDILLLNTIQILPLIRERKEDYGIDFHLGRLSGFQALAGESNFSSYGEVGHSPPRYNVPGRIIINKSNSFFWSQSGLDGLLDLVNRSWKPLQETAWGSIGNLLTSIEIRYALHRRDLLVPYRVYESEGFRNLQTHKRADRGGFTFSPKVGLHRDVYECDFASLFPNIMIEKGLSPETVRCSCHPDREDVPEIGYSICPDRNPFLSEVLRPIVEDRAEIKAELKDAEDESRREQLEEKSAALKWILVSCFGYQGHAHAKFGSNSVHQAINAFDRKIMLHAKESFESQGYQIPHGIVDSIWASKDKGSRKEVQKICEEITEKVGIELELENHFEWIAFVPRKDSRSGTLTRYFGKKSSGGFKIRGIESRQGSTPSWIAEKQKELLQVLDSHMSSSNPGQAVVTQLEKQLKKLESGDVDPRGLVIEKTVRKEFEDYQQYNRSAAALDRAGNLGFSIKPGQKARYVVADDDLDNADRVRLEFEDIRRYDSDFYRKLLIRAAASITSPLGMREQDLQKKLGVRDLVLKQYSFPID